MQRRTIEQWLHDAIENDGHRRFDDLHIDEIDPRYEEPALWLSGIVIALDRAAAIRDVRGWPFTLAGGIALKSSGVAEGLTIAGPDDIADQFDAAPPSLYAFPKDREPWALDHQAYVEIPSAVAGAEEGTRCFFGEWFDDADREYRRTVWISR